MGASGDVTQSRHIFNEYHCSRPSQLKIPCARVTRRSIPQYNTVSDGRRPPRNEVTYRSNIQRARFL